MNDKYPKVEARKISKLTRSRTDYEKIGDYGMGEPCPGLKSREQELTEKIRDSVKYLQNRTIGGPYLYFAGQAKPYCVDPRVKSDNMTTENFRVRVKALRHPEKGYLGVAQTEEQQAELLKIVGWSESYDPVWEPMFIDYHQEALESCLFTQ